MCALCLFLLPRRTCKTHAHTHKHRELRYRAPGTNTHLLALACSRAVHNSLLLWRRCCFASAKCPTRHASTHCNALHWLPAAAASTARACCHRMSGKKDSLRTSSSSNFSLCLIGKHTHTTHFCAHATSRAHVYCVLVLVFVCACVFLAAVVGAAIYSLHLLLLPLALSLCVAVLFGDNFNYKIRSLARTILSCAFLPLKSRAHQIQEALTLGENNHHTNHVSLTAFCLQFNHHQLIHYASS